MKKEKIEKEVSYELNGCMIVTNWYNQTGWTGLLIKTYKDGLNEIKKEPLQDYISYGVQSVDYVYLDIFKIETWIENGKEYTAETIEPIETIESGSIPEKVNIDEVIEQVYTNEPAIVNY